MPGANLALAFGALVAGAVVIDYGTKSARASFNSNTTGPGSAPGALPSAGVGNLPVQGKAVVWGRTDQGVDAVAPAGLPITAIASGVVSDIVDFYHGQPAVVIDTPGLPGGATAIFYGEGISPSVKKGDKVVTGQRIGTTTGVSNGLEFGFWKGSATLAQATTGYIEGQITDAGKLFHDWLNVPDKIF